jgi:hypothetical protein
VAREVSALTGAALTLPDMSPVAVTIQDKLPVKISAPDLCGRFSGRVIRGVNARAATPAWMVQRLERSGQRSISALVDISNYVMLELGRPSHVFDLDKIHGGLDVRWGRKGEQLKLLNGNTVEVDEQVGVIADDKEIEAWPASWAATAPPCRSTRPISTWKPRSGGPMPSRAARAATTSRPMPRIASSAAWTTPPRSSTSSASPR